MFKLLYTACYLVNSSIACYNAEGHGFESKDHCEVVKLYTKFKAEAEETIVGYILLCVPEPIDL